MIGLNNDEHSTNPLPIWATLTEVSDALGLSRDLVRASVRAAFKREELWVKKEDGRLLVHTLSGAYTSQVSQWLRQKDLHALLSEEYGDEQAEQVLSSGERLSPEQELSVYRAQATHDWLDLCAWLSTQGLSVFYNVLAGEPEVSLQWQWGDLQGESRYTDVKEAVIDALDGKLNIVPLLEHDLLSSSASSSSVPNKEGPRFWGWWKKGAHAPQEHGER